MKKNILTTSVVIGLIISTLAPIGSVQAFRADPTEIEEAQKEAREAREALQLAEGDKLQLQLKDYGQKAIQQRIKSLEHARNQINSIQGLSAEDQAELINNLAAAENGLNTLLGQINGEEDVEKLREHVKNIFYNYRIYAVELQKTYGLQACMVFEYLIEEKVEVAYETIDGLLATLQSSGVDTSNLEALIAEFKGYIGTIKTDLTAAKAEFRAMVAAQDLTEAHTHLLTGREYLHNARENMMKARKVLQQIKAEVKKLMPEKTVE